MLNAYLTEDEFCRKYSSYQKGQTVTLIKPIYCNKGKYEVGTEFVIDDVKLRIVLPNVFSSEADNYYADGRMFLYTVHPKESNNDVHTLDIEYFEKENEFAKKEYLVAMLVFALLITFLIGFAINAIWYKETDISYWFDGMAISSVFTIIVTYQKPRLHKKRK